jgi:thiamine transport system ATP-binding protein
VRDGAAARVLAAAGVEASYAVALRRSALVVDPTGPLRGVVASARVTPELVRLAVAVDDLGPVDAVAALGSRVAPGDAVTLRVDRTRLAVLPTKADGRRSLH